MAFGIDNSTDLIGSPVGCLSARPKTTVPAGEGTGHSPART